MVKSQFSFHNHQVGYAILTSPHKRNLIIMYPWVNFYSSMQNVEFPNIEVGIFLLFPYGFSTSLCQFTPGDPAKSPMKTRTWTRWKVGRKGRNINMSSTCHLHVNIYVCICICVCVYFFEYVYIYLDLHIYINRISNQTIYIYAYQAYYIYVCVTYSVYIYILYIHILIVYTYQQYRTRHKAVAEISKIGSYRRGELL